MSDSIGLSREVARDSLEKLVNAKNNALKLMKDKGYLDNPFTSDQSSKEALEYRVNDLRRQIAEVREYYSLHLLESLDSESKKLTSESKTLTSLNRWLIGLTVALTASTVLLVIRTLIG